VQGVQSRCRGGAGGAGEVQGRCRGCRDGAGYLHHLHLSKHNIRCREVQEVQAHLRSDSVLSLLSYGGNKLNLPKTCRATPFALL
jgi:hypothetical protein